MRISGNIVRLIIVALQNSPKIYSSRVKPKFREYFLFICSIANYYRRLFYNNNQIFDTDPRGPPAFCQGRKFQHLFELRNIIAIEQWFESQESRALEAEWYNPSVESKEGKFALCLLVICWHGVQKYEGGSGGVDGVSVVARQALKAWVKTWNLKVLEVDGLL